MIRRWLVGFNPKSNIFRYTIRILCARGVKIAPTFLILDDARGVSRIELHGTFVPLAARFYSVARYKSRYKVKTLYVVPLYSILYRVLRKTKSKKITCFYDKEILDFLQEYVVNKKLEKKKSKKFRRKEWNSIKSTPLINIAGYVLAKSLKETVNEATREVAKKISRQKFRAFSWLEKYIKDAYYDTIQNLDEYLDTYLDAINNYEVAYKHATKFPLCYIKFFKQHENDVPAILFMLSCRRRLSKSITFHYALYYGVLLDEKFSIVVRNPKNPQKFLKNFGNSIVFPAMKSPDFPSNNLGHLLYIYSSDKPTPSLFLNHIVHNYNIYSTKEKLASTEDIQQLSKLQKAFYILDNTILPKIYRLEDPMCKKRDKITNIIKLPHNSITIPYINFKQDSSNNKYQYLLALTKKTWDDIIHLNYIEYVENPYVVWIDGEHEIFVMYHTYYYMYYTLLLCSISPLLGVDTVLNEIMLDRKFLTSLLHVGVLKFADTIKEYNSWVEDILNKWKNYSMVKIKIHSMDLRKTYTKSKELSEETISSVFDVFQDPKEVSKLGRCGVINIQPTK